MLTVCLTSSAVLTAVSVASMSVPPQPGETHEESPASYVVFSQPWTNPAASHTSRIESCDNPALDPSACYDDFYFREDSGMAVGVRWWGTLRNREQVGRSYYIAIYSQAGCQPGDLLYKDCVRPQVQLVGTDCQGEYVCRFSSLIDPFPVQADTQYWIQISENDADSLTPGIDDFRWSARQGIYGCNALKSFGQNEFSPVIDPCNDRMMDMAFQLYVDVP